MADTSEFLVKLFPNVILKLSFIAPQVLPPDFCHSKFDARNWVCKFSVPMLALKTCRRGGLGVDRLLLKLHDSYSAGLNPAWAEIKNS